jgi:hypothetical protein
MTPADFNDLRSRVKEIEELAQFPNVAGHIERINHLAISMARLSAADAIPHRAMVVADAIAALKRAPESEARTRVNNAISALLDAIDAAEAKTRLGQ